ncbi:hypothetical protein COCSUDRAFT_34540 [Coccomyxa subellipsoidea C-169]|uniref:Uncharacterized protein n=1 Tax=Coccomyxa subellipsoidea (strain C-169) TaxID=574566 RepID=I0YIY0_COCSC|nr:hypothetical protein COCSUDRAFT_34540 [Coccomyxa subellipsoidea C-169]EIE18349.1 hypothetical protein COCSUDRAFT_34540 [Coccomyxa subellipsoidea C-169]|eukprot:XP_005642893.1 hypothetical protein COCSUDRAFT_34540 [Coccomyxa subellipsoidea C-169]
MIAKRLGNGGLVANTITEHKNPFLTLDLYSREATAAEGLYPLLVGMYPLLVEAAMQLGCQAVVAVC